MIAPFHERPEYRSALGASMRPYLAQLHDHLLLSYHGLPERHVRKAGSPSCCQQPPASVLECCHRAQCGAFVADCIEPLEEIGIRGRGTFLAAGGEELTLIPCLNHQPQWADAVAALCRQPSDQTLAA